MMPAPLVCHFHPDKPARWRHVGYDGLPFGTMIYVCGPCGDELWQKAIARGAPLAERFERADEP